MYFPLSLCHTPFSPTPDDAQYSSWDPLTAKSDTAFFPSMVSYMDKKVNQIITKINDVGLAENTLIIFMGDNGTPIQVVSKFNGKLIEGGKGTTTIYGTNVPLILNWNGFINPGQLSNNLLDASDFLPTIADVAGINKPNNYGVLDGNSFYPLIQGSSKPVRDWSYCYWNPQNQSPVFRVWVQDQNYKQYDSTYNNYFFNIAKDPFELNPISQTDLNIEEIQRNKTFNSVLSVMHN